ncbi:MAG: hypothetical protein J6386_20345 [Candidatus Synoicihabitans palmerolidicus]|nr:hypothetical protein [Candidatus Synoicihabitans palmerolidicus]
MASGATTAHRELKRLALEWARRHGFAIAATEVWVPKSGYRADGAVYAPRRHRVRAEYGAVAGKTAVFECKQARADLLKDSHDDVATKRKLAVLFERRAKLEDLIGEHRPDLRRGESLFPEYDAWDCSGLEHKAYHDLLAEISVVQTKAKSGTKFSKMLRYCSADILYLVVADDIYAEAEIPAGWGLLVRRGEELELRRAPAALETSDEQRRALLEAIALKATRPHRLA